MLAYVFLEADKRRKALWLKDPCCVCAIAEYLSSPDGSDVRTLPLPRFIDAVLNAMLAGTVIANAHTLIEDGQFTEPLTPDQNKLLVPAPATKMPPIKDIVFSEYVLRRMLRGERHSTLDAPAPA